MNKETEKLLRCAIEAGASGQNSTEVDATTSSTDKEWLASALEDIAGPNKLVKRLQSCVAILSNNLKGENVEVEDLQGILEEISEICENIDLACDLHKVGGFPIIEKYLHSENQKLRFCAADVFASVAQNNEYCQEELVKMEIIPTLLTMTEVDTDNTSQDETDVAQKSVHAISCIIRQNTKALNAFVKSDGFSFLVKALLTPHKKLQLRTVFLIKSLCSCNNKIHRYIHEMGFLHPFLKILDESKEANMIEFVLDIIDCLLKGYRPFKKELQNHWIKVNSALDRILSDKELCDGRDEIIDTCKNLTSQIQIDDSKEELER